mmetsp:Transcript_7479/g.11008  ORF Transcript_7479/g.11008 Transcript_7479/m.11008 type:complete len:150 (+) Transcript_7479:369-818(+)
MVGQASIASASLMQESRDRLKKTSQQMNAMSHLHSTAQKWGRHISAKIDFIAFVALPLIFFSYVFFEFSGGPVHLIQKTEWTWLYKSHMDGNEMAVSPTSPWVYTVNQRSSNATCYKTRQHIDQQTLRDRYQNFENKIGFQMRPCGTKS